MASKLYPVKNDAGGYTFRCVLFAQSDNQIISNPTLASGDWTISKDGGAFANLATLPDVDPDSTVQVKVVLSQAEINADEVVIVAKDASGAQWHSTAFVLHTVAAGYDSLSTLTAAQVNAEADTAISDAGLVTAVADLPTNAELATALASADDAVLAAVATLNNLSAAGVRAAVGLATANLDTQIDEVLTAIDGIEAGSGLDAAGVRAAIGMAAADLDDQMDGLGAVLATAAVSLPSAVAAGTVNIYRGDTLTAAFTGLGNISTRATLRFTIKTNPELADTQATVQIEETAGLVYLNGAAGTSGQGDIVVANAVTGAITVTMTPAATALLVPGAYMYDIQYVTAAGAVTTVGTGNVLVTSDVTRVIV